MQQCSCWLAQALVLRWRWCGVGWHERILWILMNQHYMVLRVSPGLQNVIDVKETSRWWKTPHVAWLTKTLSHGKQRQHRFCQYICSFANEDLKSDIVFQPLATPCGQWVRAGYMARGQRVAAEWGGSPARLGPRTDNSQLAAPSTSNESNDY